MFADIKSVVIEIYGFEIHFFYQIIHLIDYIDNIPSSIVITLIHYLRPKTEFTKKIRKAEKHIVEIAWGQKAYDNGTYRNVFLTYQPMTGKLFVDDVGYFDALEALESFNEKISYVVHRYGE